MIPNKWYSKSAKASAFAFKLRKKRELLLRLGVALVVLRHLHDEQVRKVTKPKISLYHAVMEHGVIRVPDYDSEDVLKGGTAAC